MTNELARAFEILGVEPGCGLAEARGAYRRQARLHHPDLGGDGDSFARIQAAWELIRREIPALAPEVNRPRPRGAGRETRSRPEPAMTDTRSRRAGSTYTAWRSYSEAPVRHRHPARGREKGGAPGLRFAEVLNRELRRFAAAAG